MTNTQTFKIRAVSKAKLNKNNKIFVSVKVGEDDKGEWLYCEASELFPLFEKGRKITAVIDTYKDFKKIVDVIEEGRDVVPAMLPSAKGGVYGETNLERIEKKIDQIYDILAGNTDDLPQIQ